MAEDYGKLSQEQIKKLAGTLSEAKDLTSVQAEIIKKVLDGETDIGKLRISYLKEFFDIYSRNLDSVARRQSTLNDGYLILDRRARQAAEKFTAASESVNSNNKSSGSGNNNGATSGSGGGGSNPPSGSSNNDSNNVYQSFSDKLLAELELDTTFDSIKSMADEWAKFFQQTEEERRNVIESEQEYLEAIETRRKSRIEEQLKNHASTVETIEQSIMDLEIARHQTEEDQINQVTELRLTQLQKSLDAEIAAADAMNSFNAKLAYSEQYMEEAGEVQSRKAAAEANQKTLEQLEDKRLKYIAKKELEAKRKNNGILSKEDAALIQKQATEKFKLDQKNLEKLNKKRVELEAAKARAAERTEMRKELKNLYTAETLEEQKQALYNLTHDETTGEKDVGKAISAAMLAVSDLAKQLEGKIDEIGKHKGVIDTRLQGSNNEKFAGSYWDQLVKDMTSVGAINPYFKQQDFAANIETLVKQGISFDLKQRAFLMTVSDKIADTFEVSNRTLLRLVRIQQEDSTAGRLGMESALNAFLNNMYETSEYLGGVADSVKGSLEEMEALMKGAEAAEVEYQVQKWLGSLYSVGMSQNAVQSISDALGKIAAGQIEGLTNGGAGNLLVMAANDAGLSIADILTDGINSSDTNKLLQAAVNYLAELSDSAKDNKVVQQQLADVFGVKASDLRAATNLVLPGTTNTIYGNSMNYSNMLNQLYKMAGSMGSRTSIGEMMTNFWENGSYTLAGSMASNPVSYFIYKMAKVVDDAAGGIDLPFVNVMGFGVDLNTTVSDLMRVAAVGAGILGSIGPMISGLGSSFSGQAMLRKLGIGSGSGLAITPRGDGGGLMGQVGGGAQSTSGSGYIGNSSSSDIKNSTIQEAEDSKKQQMIEAKEEEEANQVNVLNTTVLQIYEILNDVVNGDRSFKVKVEGYGLTKAGGGGAQGGVSGALNLSRSDSFGASSGGGIGNSSLNSSGSINSSGISGSVDFGGWTTA